MRVSDRLNTYMEESLGQHAAGQDFDWETTVLATPNGPVAQISLFGSGVILGSVIFLSVLMESPSAITPEVMDRAVTKLLDEFANQRTAALANPEGNGQGLIVP